MGSEFLLGEYGARIENLETTVVRMDKNIDFLVQRETVRATRERTTRTLIGVVGGIVGTAITFVLSLVTKWVMP